MFGHGIIVNINSCSLQNCSQRIIGEVQVVSKQTFPNLLSVALPSSLFSSPPTQWYLLLMATLTHWKCTVSSPSRHSHDSDTSSNRQTYPSAPSPGRQATRKQPPLASKCRFWNFRRKWPSAESACHMSHVTCQVKWAAKNATSANDNLISHTPFNALKRFTGCVSAWSSNYMRTEAFAQSKIFLEGTLIRSELETIR